MSEGLASSEVNADIERKWFDSLVGYDNQNRKVPAENLTPKQKYGIQNRPRQSMFVNRYEALKQYVERVNLVLKENIITDIYDISSLLTKEEVPNIILGKYDTVIDTIDELRFVSTNKLVHAELTPVIQNGKIVRVVINNSGRGYKVAPNYVLTGTGTDAEFTNAGIVLITPPTL
jgi:tRNA A37 threonylcarbamoyladenosine dehydratase